jgi:hypothetical protein
MLNRPDMDAIVWEVDELNHLAYVRVQGSSTNITVDINRNISVLPSELKKGNAVQLRFIGGKRRYQVVGVGKSIPTPVSGGSLPTPATLADQILSGFDIGTVCGGMYVSVDPGQFRLNGTTYTFSAPTTDPETMTAPPPMMLDTLPETYMGTGPHCVGPFDTTAAGYGRYDALVIGSDLTIDIVKGTEALISSTPSKPLAPANHVVICYLFIHDGIAEFTPENIRHIYIEPHAAGIEMEPTGTNINVDDEFTWHLTNDYPTCSIVVTVNNGYDGTYDLENEWCTLSIEETGTGRLYSSETQLWGSSVKKRCRGSVTFTYERDQTTTEHSPVLKATFQESGHLTGLMMLLLLDASGVIIP